MNHKYSTFAILIIFVMLVIVPASGLLGETSQSDLDKFCSNNQSFLFRYNDSLGWGCFALSDINVSGGGNGTRWIINPLYLYNDSTTLYFNETKLNNTIDARVPTETPSRIQDTDNDTFVDTKSTNNVVTIGAGGDDILKIDNSKISVEGTQSVNATNSIVSVRRLDIHQTSQGVINFRGGTQFNYLYFSDWNDDGFGFIINNQPFGDGLLLTLNGDSIDLYKNTTIHSNLNSTGKICDSVGCIGDSSDTNWNIDNDTLINNSGILQVNKTKYILWDNMSGITTNVGNVNITGNLTLPEGSGIGIGAEANSDGITITSDDADDPFILLQSSDTGNGVQIKVDADDTNEDKLQFIGQNNQLLTITFSTSGADTITNSWTNSAGSGRLQYSNLGALTFRNTAEDKDILFQVNDGGTQKIWKIDGSDGNWQALTTGIFDFDDDNITTTGSIKGGNYLSSSGNAGITDSSSYWVCTASDCSTTGQLQIENGLIVGVS